jgi:hypothetical protein
VKAIKLVKGQEKVFQCWIAFVILFHAHERRPPSRTLQSIEAEFREKQIPMFDVQLRPVPFGLSSAARFKDQESSLLVRLSSSGCVIFARSAVKPPTQSIWQHSSVLQWFSTGWTRRRR